MPSLGYCHCCCGKKTRLAPRNRHDLGHVKGEPLLYINGHNVKPPRPPLGADDYTIEDRGHVTPCWIWKGSCFRDGYPQTKVGDERYAHRAMWKQERGPLPKGHGLELHHLCEQRACVNPDHLEPLKPRTHALIHHGKFSKRRLLVAFAVIAMLVSAASASAASKVQPLKFIERITFVTGLHPTSGLSGFPARDYGGLSGAPVGALVRAPFSGCVPTNRPWGWLAFQSPNEGFGGARVYLRRTKTGQTAYLSHFGNPTFGGLFKRPGECFRQGDPIGHLWSWPGNPGRTHVHMGYQGGDPLYALVDTKGNFLIQEGVVWTPEERIFPRPILRREGQWWRVQVGEKRVYQGGKEKAGVVYNRQKLARTINVHFKNSFTDSPLVGHGLPMVKVFRARDVDPRLPAAIASCETSGGTKGNGPKVNNDFGLLLPGSSFRHREFKNRKAAFVYLAKLLDEKYIAKGFDTIPKIGAKYAPVGASNDPNNKNSRWVSCVTKTYKQLNGTRYL